VYEYTWVENTNTYNVTEYNESEGEGDVWTESQDFEVPTYPSSYSGWTATSTYRWQMNYQIYGYLDSDGGGASNDIWVVGDLKSYFSCIDNHDQTQQEQIYSAWENNVDTYGTDGWRAQTTKTISGYHTDDISFKVDAEAGYGTDSVAKTGIKVISIDAGRQFRREVPVSAVSANNFTWDSYNYDLGQATVIASGTLQYQAIA
jgi:hypothetical protein